MIDTSALSRQFETYASTLMSLLNSVPTPQYMLISLDKDIRNVRETLELQKTIASNTPQEDAEFLRRDVIIKMEALYAAVEALANTPDIFEIYGRAKNDGKTMLLSLHDLLYQAGNTAIELACDSAREFVIDSRNEEKRTTR